jgi:ankyrin repeat protein
MKNLKKQILFSVAFVALCITPLSFGINISQIIRDKDIAKIRELVADKTFDINQKDIDGYTPLITACSMGHLEIVKELLKHPNLNINMNDGSEYKRTALSFAMYNKSIELVKLLAHGAVLDEIAIQNAGDYEFAEWSSFKNGIETKHKEKNIYKIYADLIHKYDKAKNKKQFIEKYKNDQEKYDLLNKRWLNSLKGKNPFLTTGGQRVLESGLKADVIIHTQE